LFTQVRQSVCITDQIMSSNSRSYFVHQTCARFLTVKTSYYKRWSSKTCTSLETYAPPSWCGDHQLVVEE